REPSASRPRRALSAARSGLGLRLRRAADGRVHDRRGGGDRRPHRGRAGDREPPARLPSGEHRRCAHARAAPGLDHAPAALRRTARRRRRAPRPDPHLGGARGRGGHPVGPRPGDHRGDRPHTGGAGMSGISIQGAGAACATPADGASVPAAEDASVRTWQGPSAPERLAILRRPRSVATGGASADPARASYFVGTYLLSSTPYEVYFVNPRAETILGQPAYASLADLPVVPDVVDVFRKDADL